MAAKVHTVASFKPGTFLENIIIRSDGSILVTAITPPVLYYLPPPESEEVVPQVVCTFDAPAMGIIEAGQDIFYISTTGFLQGGNNKLWKLDMNSYKASDRLEATLVLTFPPRAKVLNGSAALSETVILCADSWADLIWRVDIPSNGGHCTARIWLEHDMLAHSQDPKKPDVPGVNGLKYNSKTRSLYFTTTAQTIFGRIQVDLDTFEPLGELEEVTDRWMWADDLIVDDEGCFAYVTTHRQNTIERVCLKTGDRSCIVGNPLHLDVIGPTAGSWSRKPGELGRVAYFSTDGGIKNPLDGVVRESKVLRVELASISNTSTTNVCTDGT